jgi:hypothetical protein
MTIFTRRTIAAQSRATFLSAVITLAGIAVGAAAIATADPEWDIGAYDSCMQTNKPAPPPGSSFPTTNDQNDVTARCCAQSGGISVYHEDGTLTCAAPAANSEGVPQRLGPPAPQPMPGPGGPAIGIPPTQAPAA